MIEDILAPSPPGARYHFVCHTCADDDDTDAGHEDVTRSRSFAYLCLHEHEHRGHDAEVLQVA